jgi:di/tricarboxylate transporter
MVIISSISAFVNNTAAVAVLIPVVIEVCRRTAASPSRVLMPMSHAATLGGIAPDSVFLAARSTLKKSVKVSTCSVKERRT